MSFWACFFFLAWIYFGLLLSHSPQDRSCGSYEPDVMSPSNNVIWRQPINTLYIYWWNPFQRTRRNFKICRFHFLCSSIEQLKKKKIKSCWLLLTHYGGKEWHVWPTLCHVLLHYKSHIFPVIPLAGKKKKKKIGNITVSCPIHRLGS